MNHKNIVAFIPARGGSKGIPGKNIRPVAGKPLVVHSIEYAAASDRISEIYVSTDDEKIAALSRSAGAQIIERPAHLSGDTATTESAVAHGLEWMQAKGIEPDAIVLLQATSPFRPRNSLTPILRHFEQGGFDSLLTLSPTHRFFWRVEGETARAEYDFLSRPRRQDMKPENIRYVENGSLYVFTSEHFKRMGNRLGGKIGYYIFPEAYAPEIDNETDLQYIEQLMKQEK